VISSEPRAIVSDGRASVPRAITACRLLYAEESNALGSMCCEGAWEGDGKLTLAWLTGTLALPVMLWGSPIGGLLDGCNGFALIASLGVYEVVISDQGGFVPSG
jgi:hypothetical protein